MVTLTLNLIQGFLKKCQACGDDDFSLYIADYNNDFQHFSTVPTPTNTIASPPPETMGKYWIQIFITEVPKYELRGLKKTLEAFFYSFLLKSVLNAAFLTLHFNSLIFGPHEKIRNFETDPKPKIALCGDRAVWSYQLLAFLSGGKLSAAISTSQRRQYTRS